VIFISGTAVSELGVQLLAGMLLRDEPAGFEETVDALMHALQDAPGSSGVLVPLTPRMRSAIREVLDKDPPDELIELRGMLSAGAATPHTDGS
jgi:hypothetical protein